MSYLASSGSRFHPPLPNRTRYRHRQDALPHTKPGSPIILLYEHFKAVAWNGRRFVAVSPLDGTIMYSADGDRWEPASEIATFVSP